MTLGCHPELLSGWRRQTGVETGRQTGVEGGHVPYTHCISGFGGPPVRTACRTGLAISLARLSLTGRTGACQTGGTNIFGYD